MTHGKLFTVCIIALALLFTSTAMAVNKAFDNEVPAINSKASLAKTSQLNNLKRDETDKYTYRYFKSADGGETWSGPMDAGDLGMASTANTEQYGVVVDAMNGIHFIAPLDGFTEDDEGVNGVYEVYIDADGMSTHTLIYEAPDGYAISWCDAGIDADGTVYALWYGTVTPEEGDTWAGIWVAKSMEDGWSDPLMVTDMAGDYPHMASDVGDYIYIISQMGNEETGLTDHFITMVPSSFEGDITTTDAVASSNTAFSYYITGVDPIAQDVDAGYVYFAVRNDDLTGVTVGSSSDGMSWSTETIVAAQRYPSIALDKTNGVPYVFSNYGIPAPGPHYAWMAYDEGGYGGGLWTEPMDYLTVTYQGENLEESEVLYVAGGTWTSDGALVAGCHSWAYGGPYTFTPWGYELNVTSDNGETWGEQQTLFNGIADDIILGGLSHGTLMAGTDNVVYFLFSAELGVNDLVPPTIRDWVTLSSTTPGEPWVVSCRVDDNVIVGYTDINWAIEHPDSAATAWEWTDGNDSAWVNDEMTMSGLYWYTMPSDSMIGKDIVEDNVEMVWFYIYAMDATGGGEGPTFSFVPGEEWMSAPAEEYTPIEFGLASNYPNPFNNSTMIPFSVDRAVDVKVAVYDVNGRLVDTVFQGNVSAGQHTVSWHAQDVVSGVYFYSLEVNGSKFMRKMTLVH